MSRMHRTRPAGAPVLLLALLTFLSSPAAAADSTAPVYSIDDTYRSALGANESIRIAEETVIQTESRIDQAWTYLYPRLVGEAGYTRFNQTLPPEGGAFIFQPLQQFQASLTLTQPLYTGGRTLAALRSAQRLREAGSRELSLARQDLLLKVAEAYYGVLKAQKTIELSRSSLLRMERHREIAEREAATRKSKANQSALLRANSLVNQARISLVRAEDGLTIARDKLRLLAKLPPDFRVTEPPMLDPPGENLEALQQQALDSRDDVASAKITKAVAEENITIVEGGHYPQVAAVAGLTYQNSDPTTALDATVYYGGIRRQVPLFEGGLMRSEVAEARSKLRQADLSDELLRASVRSEVQEAVVTLRTLTSVIDTARLQLEYARSNYEAVEGLFTEGLLASLSLIDAEQALSAAERELAFALYDRQLAILRVQKAVGRLGRLV